jgi:hypothetical protein
MCHTPESVDYNALCPSFKENDPKEIAGDPTFHGFRVVLQSIEDRVPFEVHKDDAVTGSTTGILSRVRRMKTNYGQRPEGIQDEEENLDVTDTYELIIHWKSAEEPFALGGDSGSLVYAREKNKIAPPGIHY